VCHLAFCCESGRTRTQNRTPALSATESVTNLILRSGLAEGWFGRHRVSFRRTWTGDQDLPLLRMSDDRMFRPAFCLPLTPVCVTVGQGVASGTTFHPVQKVEMTVILSLRVAYSKTLTLLLNNSCVMRDEIGNGSLQFTGWDILPVLKCVQLYEGKYLLSTNLCGPISVAARSNA
jgi:hypothetical protein